MPPLANDQRGESVRMSNPSHNDNTAPIVERQTPPRPPAPTDNQRRWMARGLQQPGGKLPLFDEDGQKVSDRTVRSCLEHGWVEPWFANPIKPDWIVCKLTDEGRRFLKSNGQD